MRRVLQPLLRQALMPSQSARRRRNRRRAVIEAHGLTCWLCLKPIAPDRLTLDHVEPRSAGGGRHRSNLRPAHAKCNRRRADGPPPELLLTRRMRAPLTAPFDVAKAAARSSERSGNETRK